MEAIHLTNSALSGGLAVACGAVALFFIRFWKASRDKLFLMLGSAFALLAVERVALILAKFAFVPITDESRHWVYVIRLLAFLLIIYAVVEKNREPRGAG